MVDHLPEAEPSRPRRGRRPIVTAVLLVVLLAAAAYVLDGLANSGSTRSGAVYPPASRAAPGSPGPAATTPATSGFGNNPAPVLALSGEFPDDGPGTYRYAKGEGEMLGESGPVHRFRLAVEDGVEQYIASERSSEASDAVGFMDEFAGFVDDTLGAPAGWTAGGDVRFQRVPGNGEYDFTIYLTTTDTTARLCATVGLDVVGGGLPDGGVSCRTPGQVVLNLSRWRLSVPAYVAAGVTLETYRQMLVNHEVGHQLGYGHEACPRRGGPAPVMQQQSIALRGCEPNPWPYLDGARYTGPPVP
jgi:hypothetical protein